MVVLLSLLQQLREYAPLFFFPFLIYETPTLELLKLIKHASWASIKSFILGVCVEG